MKNIAVPADRGRLLFVEDIAKDVFRGQVSEWWVRRNVAPTRKLRLSHSRCAWYEQDVHAWLQSRVEEAA
jgi:hypothetical protein